MCALCKQMNTKEHLNCAIDKSAQQNKTEDTQLKEISDYK